jgi:radical SAM superfamily enzyme YgiQ (UPF0313 family)
MAKPRVLLVNPPIYDFAAHDFWLRPYGMLRAAGFLRSKAEFSLFDYLDRLAPFSVGDTQLKSDRWGRGRFPDQRIDHPDAFRDIPRYFRRFGLPRCYFQEYLKAAKPPDFVFIQTVMTYWYLGVKEVIEDIRRYQPQTRIVLGGNYATLCPDHARSLGPDVVIEGKDMARLWDFLGLEGDGESPALWESYRKLKTGALKLAEGCPFQCTYCSVPKVYGCFRPLSMSRALAELEMLAGRGVSNVAFYDDALLYKADEVLTPFLDEVLGRGIRVNFHSPNALNARFVTPKVAEMLVGGGFKMIYLGFESAARDFQQKTGSKVFSDELLAAVENLKAAEAEPGNITAYQILGHPDSDIQEMEESMRFVARLGIRGMLADFSPIPGTPDGERCREWVDLDEPLMHNKTAFTILRLGFEESNRLKDLQRRLNRSVET